MRMTVERTSAPGTSDRLGLLLAHHGALTGSRMRQALTATGHGMRHAVVLMRLAEYGPMGQQALIEALDVDPSVLVSLLNDLEGEGLAERRRGPADRRRHIVEMTEAGAAVLGRMHESFAAVERELFADLDDDEIDQLYRLLGRVRTSPGESACAAEAAACDEA